MLKFGNRSLSIRLWVKTNSSVGSGSILNNRDQEYPPKTGAIRIVISVQNVKCYWCGYQKIVQIQSLAPSHLQNQDVCRESNSSNQAYKRICALFSAAMQGFENLEGPSD